MATSYDPYYSGGWQSGEEGGTPITPDALNHMDDGIAGAYDYTQQSTATRFGSNSATDFDNLIMAGIFSVTISATGHRPVSNIGSYAVIVISSSMSSTANSAITQIAIPTGSNTPNGVYIRNRSAAGVWSAWYKISATAVS